MRFRLDPLSSNGLSVVQPITTVSVGGSTVSGGDGASVSDSAYGSGWDGETATAPSQNAVYDAIEALDTGKMVITIAAHNTTDGANRADYVCESDFADEVINAAIATLPAAGGEIRFLEGQYNCRDSIVLPNHTMLKGSGRNNTKIFKVVDGFPLLKYEGSSSAEANYARNSAIVDLTFEGNAKTGALLHCYYAQTLFVARCSFDGSASRAFDFVQLQDSYFLQVTANTNTSTTERVMKIAGGPGGSSNMLFFTQCRIEDYRLGAIEMEQGSGYSGNCNGFFFSQCKFETTQTRGDVIVMDDHYLEVHFNQIFGHMGSFASGFSTPSYFINSDAKGLVSFQDVMVNVVSGVCAGVLNLTVLNGTCKIDNILCDGTPTVGVVNFDGSSGGKFSIGNLATGGGTLITGHATGITTVFSKTTFEQDVTVPDEAYDATNWNGNLEVPTKNAVRDEMETRYKAGGTDVALADGGTGASLTDPNADRVLFWDDSAGAMTWLTMGTNLTITGTTLDATGGAGGGDALTTNPLSQFAATTSAELGGVISDETGSGALVFGTSPTIATPSFTGSVNSAGALILGGAFGTPVAVTVPSMTLLTNNNLSTGIEIRNDSTGTVADSRFALADTTGNYLAFSLPSTGNTGTALFGMARATTAFLFNNGGTTRDLAIGTLGAKAVVLGANNSERIRIASDGTVVVNENGASVDTRIEGDTDANLVFVDASTDRVGIGTATPGFKFSVNGANGQLSLSADTDGGAFNLNATASGSLAIYGTAGNILDVDLLDGALKTNGTTRLTNAGILQNTNTLLTAAPSADHSVSGTTIQLVANENQAIGDVCYINADGQAQLADADAIATSVVQVMCADATIAADATGTYLLMGVARDDTWAWTVGGLVYLSTTGTTGNTLTQTAPSGTDDCVVVVGVATHADRMLFRPSQQGIVEVV